jgi:hypothetical protein
MILSLKFPRAIRKTNVSFVVALLVFAFWGVSCQNPFEPTTITVKAPTTINVEDQSNNLVSDAGLSVRWKILGGVDSSWHTMPPQNIAVASGVFGEVLPLPVTDDTSHVVFQINAPLGYTPITQSDTEVGYCGSKVFTYHITAGPITLTVCNPTAIPSNVSLVAKEPSKPNDLASTRTFINNLGPLTFSWTSVPVLPGPGLPKLEIYYSVDNAASTPMPASLMIGAASSYSFQYHFSTNPLTAQQARQQYVATLLGRDAGGNTCIKHVDTVRIEIQVPTPCDCPTGDFNDSGSVATCKGVTVQDTVSIKTIRNTNTSCKLVFKLASSSIVDDDVSLSPDLNGLSVLPGNAVPGKVVLTLSSNTAKTYDVHYDYSVEREDSAGNRTRCDSVLRIWFHAIVGTPSCQIDQSSGLLHDTLKQVINSDSNTGVRSLCINNPSPCPLKITSAVLGGADPGPFHIASGIPLSIPANGSGCVTVSFNPKETDVWPSGRGVGIIPINLFHATLSVRTSAGCDTVIPVVGLLEPATDNPNCFLQWGTNDTYTGIVLGDSGTISISPNKSSPNGFSIYVSSVTGTGTPTATFASGNKAGVPYVQFSKIANGITVSSPNTICDESSTYTGQCGTTNATTSSTIVVNVGDVILFEYSNTSVSGFLVKECGLMFIEGILRTNQTDPTAPYKVCFQLCFPI